ncbi:50S ribosomal protein L3 [Candidatus Dependentiae bacterium]|nr:50S ribosomal protein L3 [Candidatus Dependentiae bacterium]MBU4387579.1 50S ribosomal protein L3 [Candidatus Dependentiae bacterium]MCG2756299.1 50S ribosomal protein L3 [Candidatus Dependentiae bacterium]
MLSSFFGKKIGMTQIFTEDGVVIPVTVINAANWFVTQIKTSDNDGYSAVQLGLLRKRFDSSLMETDWLKNKNNYFSIYREVRVDAADLNNFKLGQKVGLDKTALSENDNVKVTGKSKGLGYQGVVKRWGFSGGPDTHGSTFHRIPGSVGNMRSQGEVLKGKKLPGHAGLRTFTTKNLKIVKVDKNGDVLFVKGAIPGKKESLICISKQG